MWHTQTLLYMGAHKHWHAAANAQCPHAGDFAPRAAHSEEKVGGVPPPLIISVGYNLQKVCFGLKKGKQLTFDLATCPNSTYSRNHLDGDRLSEGGRWSSLGQQFPGRNNLRTQSGQCKTLFPDSVAGQKVLSPSSSPRRSKPSLSSTCFVERG